MTESRKRRSTSPRRRGRLCRHSGCERFTHPGKAYCRSHLDTPEALAFQRQLQSAINRSAGLDLTEKVTDTQATLDAEYAAEKSRRRKEYAERARKGEYSELLDAMVTRVLEQAEREVEVDKELAIIRVAFRKVYAEEPDGYRLLLALSRGATAMSKLMLANYATKQPKPVSREGREWSDRLPGEGLIKFLFRHRPDDFFEKFGVRLEELDEKDRDLERKIQHEYEKVAHDPRNQPDAEGRYGPVIPHSLEMEFEMRVRAGEFTKEDWLKFQWENERRHGALEPHFEAHFVQTGQLSAEPDARFFASDNVVHPPNWKLNTEREPEKAEPIAEIDEADAEIVDPLPGPGPPKRFSDNHKKRTARGNAIDDDDE